MWPDGARCAASFTFDFDAEEVWIGEDPENAHRPGVLSQGTYGAKVAVPEMHWDELRSRAALSGTTFDEQVEMVRAAVPLGRHGIGGDIAGVVAWLVSHDAGYVTGQTIGVNGGIWLS